VPIGVVFQFVKLYALLMHHLDEPQTKSRFRVKTDRRGEGVGECNVEIAPRQGKLLQFKPGGSLLLCMEYNDAGTEGNSPEMA
jgi:hypothetical protein